MPLSNLTAAEQAVVLECLRASVEGPFFIDSGEDDPYWEFPILFGLKPEEVREVVRRWPVDDEQDEIAQQAINNALNLLLIYPHHCERQWPQYISMPLEEIPGLYAKWLGRPLRRCFDELR